MLSADGSKRVICGQGRLLTVMRIVRSIGAQAPGASTRNV
jgi:hypothetical protein